MSRRCGQPGLGSFLVRSRGRHPRAGLCPAGLHGRSRKVSSAEPCMKCAADDARRRAMRAVRQILPAVAEEEVRTAIDIAARTRTPWLILAAHLEGNPDALSSGRSDVPCQVVALVNALLDVGAEGVVRLKCIACARPSEHLECVGDGGRLCPSCADRRREPESCVRCGRLRHVTIRTADGGSICQTCRVKDTDLWEECSVCGKKAPVVSRMEGKPIGRCCYARPVVRCTMCGIGQGVRAWKTRRPVCRSCGAVPSTPCSVCTRAAPRPEAGEPAVCALCRVIPARACRGCGRSTPGRDRGGEPRCFDCYQRPVRPCGRCHRVRAIVRLATGPDPDLCALCWTGPTVTCESCGDVRPCRGERRGWMLCTKCAPRTPQRCAHCGRLKRVGAQWTEGPICPACYYRALAAKATCPGCGRRRRLRRWKGLSDKVCSDCASEKPHSVCRECGVEDHLYERGLCPACGLRHRLVPRTGSTSLLSMVGRTRPCSCGSDLPGRSRRASDWRACRCGALGSRPAAAR